MTIHHMVFVKFKRDARKEDIQRALAEIDRLPERNREIKNWVSGFSPEPRFHNGAFDHGLACDLADWDAMDRYMYHEAHISAGPLLKPLAEYWRSFDFVVDYAAPKRFPARSKRPKPRLPRLPENKVMVPWVRGRRLAHARQTLEEAGLRVGKVEAALGGVWAAGRVTAQNPDKGTIVDKGTAINLTITGEFWMAPKLP